MEYMEARIQDQFDGFNDALEKAYKDGQSDYAKDKSMATNPYSDSHTEIWKAWELGWFDGYKSAPPKP